MRARRCATHSAAAVTVVAVVVAAVAVFGLALDTATSPAMAQAAADDQLPGAPLAVGATVTDSVGRMDANDVYAVSLTVGEEVHVRCEPGRVEGSGGRLHLLIPGAQNLAGAGPYDELTYELSGGKTQLAWADYDYIPARSGTYYLWVEWGTGALDYSLSVTRTLRAALPQTGESDDIPGIPLGSTAVTGVVSTLADPDDVYAVTLTAGRQVVFRLAPLGPYHNHNSSRAHLYLLVPQALSLEQRFGHVVWGLVPAVNDLDAADRLIAQVSFVPAVSGTYYLWVEAGRVYSSNFAYRLSARERLVSFTDVDGSPYQDAVYELADEGIISGFEDGTFRPHAPVSRQQFAKMIVNTLGLTPTGDEVSPFSDVSGTVGTDPFYPDKYVAVCAAAGITQGYPGGLFKPEEDIRRMQLITMVTRAAQLPKPPLGMKVPFPEFDATHYPFARWAYGSGLLAGLAGMGPDFQFVQPATRGECARLLANLLHTR